MEVLAITPDWTIPYIAYILRKELPEDEEEARQTDRPSIQGLYSHKGTVVQRKRDWSRSEVYTPEEGQIFLDDIHSGTYGHHASSRTIVAKAYRAGFYRPRANEMAKEIVDKCEGCQFYSNMSHKPASALKTIPLV